MCDYGAACCINLELKGSPCVKEFIICSLHPARKDRLQMLQTDLTGVFRYFFLKYNYSVNSVHVDHLCSS